MARVLILDDDENRHLLFSEVILPRAQRQHVWTANQAVKALRDSPPFDIVFLDHDLQLSEGLVGIGSPGNGTQVAYFIAHHLPRNRYPRRIVIHSHNEEGTARMEALLRPTGIPITIRRFPI